MKKNLFFLFSLLVIALPFLPEPAAEATTEWPTFLGRFHILLLHFPIVLVLGLLALELGKKLRPEWEHSRISGALWMAAPLSCVLTALAGYLLYLSGEYQGALVRNHLWGGVLLTVIIGVAAYLRESSRLKPKKSAGLLTVGLLLFSGVLVIYTSHLGGSLTHGPEFLTEYAPDLVPEAPAAIEQKPKEELLVFQDLIMPVLDRRCLSCHNEYKTKGDLLMTSHAALLAGGKSGKEMLVAGDPEGSEFFHRLTLPEEDDDHMPPPEKPGLSEDEIALIEWWIKKGADPEMQLGNGPEGPEGQALIDRMLPDLARAQRLKARQEQELQVLQEELQQMADPLGLVITPDREAPGFFAVSQTVPPRPVNDEMLTDLLEYAEVFTKVSLPGALITDDGLFELSKMSYLQRLYVPKTCIKGPGLAYLQSLESLEELNLSYTFLEDAGALQLLRLPQLRKVYLFGTEVHPNVIEALRKNLPEVEIEETEGRYF